MRLSPCQNMCYGPKRIGIQQRICNYRLTRARRMAECAFGVLTSMRRIFHRPPFDATPQFRVNIVKACCNLHSFVRRNDGFQLEGTLYASNFESIQAFKRKHLRKASKPLNFRQVFYVTTRSCALAVR